MQKIPTVFQRGDDGLIIQHWHPDCLWVGEGEGMPTEKLDGTNIRLTIRAGTTVRVEKRRNPTKAQKAAGIVDPWYVDACDDNPGDKWIMAAAACVLPGLRDGEHCCEAIGPKIQGNPLALADHGCVPFDFAPPVFHDDPPRAFDGLARIFQDKGLVSVFAPGRLAEGIVWHHPDGRRAKIKRKDFERISNR